MRRGGSWNNTARWCRSAYRNRNHPSNRWNNLGFRASSTSQRQPVALHVFEIDLDLRATPFQKAVYKHVAKIGYGETLSYSDIAEAMGNPKAVRAVGAANGANPIPLVIPCHRVIARGGALQGYAGGLDLKARLLAMEQALPEPVPEQARLF